MNPFVTICDLEDNSSRLDKEAILKANDTPLLRFVLEATYNPFKRYNINSKIDDVVGKGTFEIAQGSLSFLLKSLAERVVTGNAAVESVTRYLESLTTDHAELVKRIIKKDLRCGVSDSTINKVFKDLIPTFDVQLAAKPERIGKMPWPAIIEPKKDGMRALGIYDGEDVEFLSRSGKPITTLDYMKDEIVELCNGIPWVFDAEAMTDTFNDSMSSIKRKTAKNTSAKLHIFDGMSYEDFSSGKCNVTQIERKKKLTEQFGNTQYKNLVLNPWEIVDSEDAAFVVYRRYREAGDEGAIVKNMEAPYVFKRSDSWIKLKPLETADFEITGMEEGEGRNKGKLGALLFDFNGVECKCGMGFSDKEREDFWRDRNIMTGMIFEAAYMEPTSNSEGTSRTRHCRFIRLRSLCGSKA